MKINFFYSFSLFLLVGALLALGCTRSSSGKKPEETVRQNANANDPRWRNELFQSNLRSIRERAAYENPEQYLNSLNQTAERFNSWLQVQPSFEGWHTDPMAVEQIRILDSLEPLKNQIASVGLEFRNSQIGAPFSEKQMAALSVLTDSLKTASENIPEGLTDGFSFMKKQLRLEMDFLTAKRFLNRVDAELIENLRRQNYIFSQLGILIGSQRMSFLSAEESHIPIIAGESFNLSYENDTYLLFEQFLLQDVSRWAMGTPETEREELRLESRNESDTMGAHNRVRVSSEDLKRMRSIFDWTILNIDLRPEIVQDSGALAGTSIPQLPLETLLSGSGTVLERAWLCILLARQQDLNMFLIEVPDSSKKRILLGFLFNDTIYLFDPEVGLPVLNIPAENAVTKETAENAEDVANAEDVESIESVQSAKPADSAVDAKAVESSESSVRLWGEGMLDVVPVTWGEVCANPSILETFFRQTGRDESVTSDQISRSRVLLEASPWYLTQRMAVLQEAIKNGENRVVLSLSPIEVLPDGTISEASLESALNAPSGLKNQILRQNVFEDVVVWNWPIDGTIYRAFNENSERGHQLLFQMFCALFPDGNFNLWRGRMLYLSGILTGPLSAADYCQRARISETVLEQNYRQAGQNVLDFYRACRCQASYSLGTISLMLQREDAAIDSYQRHVLGTPFTSFHDGANYRAGRACELKEDWLGAHQFYSKILGPMRFQAQARMAILPKISSSKVEP